MSSYVWTESSTCYAKRMEYLIISRFMAEGFKCFQLLAADNGTDYVIKSRAGNFYELQIKARKLKTEETGFCTKGSGRFQVKNPVSRSNYYYIFFVEQINTTWCMTSQEYLQLCSRHKSRKNMQQTSLVLTSPSGKPHPKFKQYELKQEDFGKKFQ